MCRACMQRWSLCRFLHEGLGVCHKVGACIALQQPHSHVHVRNARVKMATTLMAACVRAL